MISNEELRELPYEELQYAIGAPLYCPADNKTVAQKLLDDKLEVPVLILDLEDAILPQSLNTATDTLQNTLDSLIEGCDGYYSKLPLIFIRVRNAEHLAYVYTRFLSQIDIISGFVLPKFDTTNATEYIRQMERINVGYRNIQYMPILESSNIAFGHRRQELKTLRHMMDNSMRPLHILTGGNDLCKIFKLRRNVKQSIYDMIVIRGILEDILLEMCHRYTISGAVWEYFDGPDWEIGLKREVELDVLNGFTGKQCIHPKQVKVVLDGMKPSAYDYYDATTIYDTDAQMRGVFKGNNSGRMNEMATNSTWAKRILTLAKVYGVEAG